MSEGEVGREEVNVGELYERIKDKKPQRLGFSLGMEGENYIVALDESKAYMLTAAAYYVWSLCDGSKTLKELIKYMSEELSENTETPMKEEELIEPVTLIVNQLSEAGLLKLT